MRFKRLLAALSVCTLLLGAAGAYAASPTNASSLLQADNVDDTTLNAGFTFTAGRQAVLQIATFQDTSVSAVTIGGSSATLIGTTGDGSTRAQTWWVSSMTGGTANIVLTTAAGSYVSGVVTEWAEGTFDGVEAQSAAVNNGTAPAATVSIANPSVMFATATVSDSTANAGFTGPSGYTVLVTEQNGSDHAAVIAAWKQEDTTGSKTATFGTGTTYFWGAALAALTLGDGPAAPTLSSATPSGTLGTETTATVGATSTASTGTFYAILSTSNNASGASCTQIKAGQNSTGASASFAEDDTVSTTSPSVGFTGLTANTLYYYAACHTDSNGDSNVASGSFTTAAADIVATKLVFGSQPGNVVVGETFGAFTVRAVDDSDALDEDFEDDVTVALETGNGELAGTLTETAVAGIATFDDVHIDTLNVDAVIQATADGLTAANSDEFDVTAGGEGGGTAGFPSSSRLGGVIQ